MVILPPPLSPVPAVILTPLWSMCSFATKPFVESCATCAEPVTTPTPPNKVSSVIEPPRDTDVPLIVIAEFNNLPFAIEPANSSFDTPLFFIVTAPLLTLKLSELNDAIPLLLVVAFSPLISPEDISIPSPALIAALALSVVKYRLLEPSDKSSVSPPPIIATFCAVDVVNVPPLTFKVLPEPTVISEVAIVAPSNVPVSYTHLTLPTTPYV